MSGHSKWAQIKRSKGIKDVKKSHELGKLSKDITLATRLGASGDINSNPYLRVAVDKAKASNMTNEKIKYAIDKGLGIHDKDNNLVVKMYEAYSPSGVAILIECETDNPNRTLGELKTYLTKKGGKFTPEGSISWQFIEVGIIELETKENLALELIDIEGVSDVNEEGGVITLITEKNEISAITNRLKEDFGSRLKLISAEISMIAENTLGLTQSQYEELENFIEGIHEISEVTNIWHNGERV